MSVLDASFIGRGRQFAKNLTAGLTAGHIELGNASQFSLAHEEEEISQQNYMTPAGGERNSNSRVSAVSLTLTLTDFNKENLERALRGSASTITTATVTDESISVPATFDTDTLIPTAKVIDIDDTVVVTTDPAGTTYTEGTDYEVVAAGIIVLAAGAISASDALLVDYTSKTVDKVESLTGGAPEFEVILSGINTAQNNSPIVVKLYKVKFGLPADLGLITDEYGSLELTGKCIADSSITATDESQYYKLEAA